jgi:hypothetical protein
MLVGHAELSALKIMDDPEAIFQIGWLLCDAGEARHGLAFLRRAVDRGYFVVRTLSNSRQFDALRGDPEFKALLADAVEGRRLAFADFRDAGGDRLLGAVVHHDELGASRAGRAH